MNLYPDYIKSLNCDAHYKKLHLDPELLSSHWFYINLIPLLLTQNNNRLKEFNGVAEGKLQKLSLSSYLYFKALLAFDAILDSKSNQAFEIFTFFNFLEKSVQELAYIYHQDSGFWKKLEHCKQVYFQTIKLEKKLSLSKECITETQFESIAEGKSAVCNAVVFALSGLLEKENPYEAAWLNCLKHLHIAFQYLDDIDDFKKDAEEGQWTYTRHLVEKDMHEQGYHTQEITTDYKYRYLFVSGIAGNLLSKAENHFNQSLMVATELQLDGLVSYINKNITRCRNQVKEINFLIEKTKIKLSKSSNFSFQNAGYRSASTHEVSEKGLAYLMNTLENGHWTDFLTSAGFGKNWITCYTGMMLAEVYPNLTILNTIADNLNDADAGKYNQYILQDGDSTNFQVGFLNILNRPLPKATIKKWFTFMDANGGWKTYNQEKELKERLELEETVSVRGWTTSKNCVSAAAAYVLSSLPQFEHSYHQTANYLVSNLTADGYLESYWYNSPVYATSLAIMALSKHKIYRNVCSNMAEWLISQQTPSGCWSNKMFDLPSAFYTALSLKALLSLKKDVSEEPIEKALTWLMANQMEDGSWQTNRILLLPATNVLENKTVPKWRNSSFGVNTVIDDHNRVFTTSTVINAIKLYQTYNQQVHAY